MPNPPTQAAIAAIRKIAANPTTRKQLGKVAGKWATKIAESKLSETQKHRAQRALAVEMARQIEGGQISFRTLIDGRPHTVVWADGTPIQAFPECKGDLEAKLHRHRRDLLVDPPEERPLRSRVPWNRDNRSSARSAVAPHGELPQPKPGAGDDDNRPR